MDEYGFAVDPMDVDDVVGERAWRRVRSAANRATSIAGPRHDPEFGPVRRHRGVGLGWVESGQLRPWDNGR